MKLTPTTRRIISALAAIALLAGGGLAALYFASRPPQPLAPSPPEVIENEPKVVQDLHSLLVTDDLLTPTGATPLETLPLDLPIYQAPGVTADKLAAYQRETDDGGEQIAIYSFRGADLQSVQAFYNDHAHRLGFTPQPAPGSSEPGDMDSGSKIYSRHDQVLLVRVRQAGQSVRLTILLRYTERR